tara:strand:- start:921 stop:1601 length:681 start_codon:yes stop_codon:yes gene_type:complete
MMCKQGKQLARSLSMVLFGTVLLASLLLTSSYVQADENQVFFRAGGAFAESDRAGEVFTDVFGAAGSQTGSDDGSYIGAGVELLLSKDVLGFLPGASLLGEIGIEYKDFGSKNVAQAVPTVATGDVFMKDVQISMLTVDIAPKIKFMQGSRLRPWVIPVGLDFHVISPPSNSTTYLDIGVQFGAGLEYRVWKALNIGVDARYHAASGQTSTVNNYSTIGVYTGIAF